VSESPPPPDNWGDAQTPESSPPDWRAQEVVPGGFVLEGQDLPALQPTRPEPVEDLAPGVLQPEVEEPLSELPAVVVQAVSEPSSVIEVPEPAEEPANLPKAASPTTPAPKTGPMPALQVVLPVQAAPADTPLLPERPDIPYILSPAAVYAGEDLHMITVVLRPGRDKVRDNLRLRQAYGVLISYPGHDRFALQIFERGRGYRVEFPNFTTGLCPELLARLQGLVGGDNILVEPLTIQ